MDHNFKDEIKIPIGLDDAVLKGFEKGRKQKMHIKSRRIKRAAAAAGIVIVSAAAITISSPKFASAISNVFNNFIAAGYHADGYNKLSQTIHAPSSTKAGVTLTLNNVSMDNNILAAVFNVKSDKLKDMPGVQCLGMHMNLNGKEAEVYESSCKMLSQNEASIMVKAAPPSLSSNKNIKFDVDIHDITIGENEINGNWKFSTVVLKTGNEKIYNCNSIIKYPDKEMKVDKLSISPLGSLLYVSTTYYNGNKEVLYSGNHNYVIRDDKGNDLLFTTEYGSREGKTDTLELNILSSLKNTKYIDIVKASGNDCIYPSIGHGEMNLLNTVGNDNEKKLEIISRQPIAEVNTGHTLKESSYCLNTEKGNYYTLNQLIGKDIRMNSTNKVTITNVQPIGNDLCKFTMQMHGSCELVDPFFFSSDMNDLNYDHMLSPGICVEDSEKKIISVTLNGIDKNKKYNIAVPMKSDVKVDESSKVRIYLNK